MLHVRPWHSGLGQAPAEKQIYCVRRPCPPFLTASQLAAALPQGGDVYAQDLPGQVKYYPTPQSVVDALGLCGALRAAYSDGFLVPTATGTERVEPGVFHYGKSWDEMIVESRALRDGTAAKFDWCQETAVPLEQTPITGVRGPGTLTLKNADGTTKCEDPALRGATVQASWSERLPAAYWNTLPVARAAAMWVASDSASWTSVRGTALVEGITCGSDPKTGTASAWGHAYDVISSDVTGIGPGGAAASFPRQLEGPVLRVSVNPGLGPAKALATTWTSLWTLGLTHNAIAALAAGGVTAKIVDAAASGQWIGLTPTQVRAAIAQGQWPPPGADKARWEDNSAEFDPRSLLGAPQVPAGPVQASAAQSGGVSTALGILGILVGGFLVARAIKEGKKT